jgi:hypothetical protein
VGVGDEDLLELEPMSGEKTMDSLNLIAGIDDDGFAGCLVAEQGAIALQEADGKGLEDHGFILVRGSVSSAASRVAKKPCAGSEVKEPMVKREAEDAHERLQAENGEAEIKITVRDAHQDGKDEESRLTERSR